MHSWYPSQPTLSLSSAERSARVCTEAVGGLGHQTETAPALCQGRRSSPFCYPGMFYLPADKTCPRTSWGVLGHVPRQDRTMFHVWPQSSSCLVLQQYSSGSLSVEPLFLSISYPVMFQLSHGCGSCAEHVCERERNKERGGDADRRTYSASRSSWSSRCSALPAPMARTAGYKEILMLKSPDSP